MKKLTALFLSVIFMCLPLFSCSGTGSTGDVTNGGDTTAPSTDVDGSQIAVATDNFSADLATVSFFFNGLYSSDKSQYGSYMTLMGLDTTKPLKDQKYGESTWFEFYLSSGLDQLESTLLFCEYAHSLGIELDEVDKQQLDNYIKQVEAQAVSNNTTAAKLISDYYGPLVTEDVFRKCLELEMLSGKGYNHYIDSLSYTVEQYEEYYSENKDLFDCVDIYTYEISATVPEDATEDEMAAIMADVKAKAENICSAESTEDFEARLGEYIKSLYTGENELSESAVSSRVKSCLTTGVTVSELINAGFAEDAEFALGSYIIVENDGSYTLIYLTGEPSRNSKLIADMRYILLTSETYETQEAAREKANEIHDEYLAGDKTVESFSVLVNEYSEEQYNKETGGLVEGLQEGALTDVEITNWLFDEDRVHGDTAVVNTASGTMVVYFEAFTGEQWQNQAHQYLQNEDYLVKIDELRETVEYTKIEDVISQFEA